jgi:hypothetical protein
MPYLSSFIHVHWIVCVRVELFKWVALERGEKSNCLMKKARKHKPKGGEKENWVRKANHC